jgi:DNA-binding IclR family transcriptional regulator
MNGARMTWSGPREGQDAKDPVVDEPGTNAYLADGRRAPATTELGGRQPKAIHSALSVIEEVARSGPGVTAHEISAALGMSRATAYRLIALLVEDEYLVRMPDLRGFALGRKVVELASLVAPPPPPRAARSVLDALRGHTRGGIHLVRYDGDRVHPLDLDPDFPLIDEARALRELDASAMGRLLLAELAATGQPLPGTVRASADRVAEIRRQTEAAGYARQVAEFSRGYGCIAVPIRGPRGRLVAGLALSAPATRVEDPGDVLDRLRDGARTLEPLLG